MVLDPNSGDAAQRMLNIRWIVDWKAEGPTPDRSPIASMRYRVLLPARALMEKGHQVEIVKMNELHAGRQLDWQGVDVLVVGKQFLNVNLNQFTGQSQHLMQCCFEARAAGTTVVADINDDHFGKPVVGDHWRALAEFADVCTVGSVAMGATVGRYTKRPIVPVGDALGSPRGSPRVYADRTGGVLSRIFHTEPLKLVWYGMTNNVFALEPWAKFIAAAWTDTPLLLRVITSRHALVDELCARIRQQFGKRGLVEFVEWEEDLQWKVVAESDVVLIPSDPADATKTVKTANRLIDALHAGRHVIATPIPSYLPYADFAELTTNPVQALHGYLNDPAAARERIQRGQAAAIRDWGADAVAESWLQAFGPRRSEPTAPSIPPAAQVRLNLGCGDKVLDGYVNVDVVESRAGRRPDVLSDLRRLDVFPDDHADEVMAIHVVEHFWRWEVEAVLREWIRILKPGGRMVLECPNLEAACAEFLRDPDRCSGPGREGQTTMWVFYGDPAWQDPLMVHRWGYTPGSLARLMELVGLVDVAQEPAQFKLREPRDMRIVGRKARL